MKVKLAKTAGFCYGVERAVNAVYDEIRKEEQGRIYTYGPIVHNEMVVDDLRKKGVDVIEGMDDLKESKERIKDKLSEGYKAYSFDAVTNKNSHHIYMGRGYWKGVQMSDKTIEGSAWNKDLISIDAIRCVADMADYCKKEGIIMLAIHAPVPHERFTEEEHYSQKEYFEDMFGEYGVKYIDFNFIKEDFLTWNEDGYTDLEGHMMGKMADEYSKVLGMVLNDYLSGRDIDEYFDDFPNMGD